MYLVDNQLMDWTEPECESRNFNGAAVIDSTGREIPITEDMVQQALHALIDLPTGLGGLHS